MEKWKRKKEGPGTPDKLARTALVKGLRKSVFVYRVPHFQTPNSVPSLADLRLNPDQILQSFHWLEVHCIQSSFHCVHYKLLPFSSPNYLRDVVTIQPPRFTRSSPLVSGQPPSSPTSVTSENRKPFLFDMQHLSYGINFPTLSVMLESSSCCQPISWRLLFSAKNLPSLRVFSSLVGQGNTLALHFSMLLGEKHNVVL